MFGNSYVKSGRLDLNQRPLRPERSARITPGSLESPYVAHGKVRFERVNALVQPGAFWCILKQSDAVQGPKSSTGSTRAEGW